MVVVFFGTPQFAVPTLSHLLASRHPVCGVVTQPDRPRGRGQKVSDAPVKALAVERGVRVIQPERLKDPAIGDTLRAWDPDIGVVVAYGRLIPDRLLEIPRQGMINVHASLLPKYRGAAPVHRAVIAGEAVTGVTVMRVATQLDSGDMFARATRAIDADETSEAVERDLSELGARVLLDGYQSAGIIPVDVTALGVDFFVGGCLKWLCGGPGTAFLYTRPDMPAVQPRYTGWFSHRSPFAFDIGVPEPRGDAMRMMNGTPSIPAFYAAIPGLDIIRAVGVSRIRAASVEMTARVLALADQYGFPSMASRNPDRLAGTVAVNPPDALAVSRALKARDFVVDYRPGVGIRVSPHFYNTVDEIDRLMAEMASIVREKTYDTAAPTRSVVT